MVDPEAKKVESTFYIETMHTRALDIAKLMPSLQGGEGAIADVASQLDALRTYPQTRVGSTVLSTIDAVASRNHLPRVSGYGHVSYALALDMRADPTAGMKAEELVAYAYASRTIGSAISKSKSYGEAVALTKRALVLQFARCHPHEIIRSMEHYRFESMASIANELANLPTDIEGDRLELDTFLQSFADELFALDIKPGDNRTLRHNQQRIISSCKGHVAIRGKQSIWHGRIPEPQDGELLTKYKRFGLGSEEVATLDRTLERLTDTDRRLPGQAQVDTVTYDCLTMILETIEAADDMGLKNARLILPLIRKPDAIDSISIPKAKQFATYIQLANGLLKTINASRASEGLEPLRLLPPRLESLTESFRRIMFVVLDGDEEHEAFEKLELGDRFEVTEKLGDVLERRHQKDRQATARGGVAIKGAKGQVQGLTNHGNWRKWVRGYGLLT